MPSIIRTNLEPGAALAVGGIATSDWLERNFADCLGEQWSDGQSPERDITQAFLQVGEKVPFLHIHPCYMCLPSDATGSLTLSVAAG